MSHKGNGYSGYSKSNNAIEAEARGEYPATKIAKLTKTDSKFIKAKFRYVGWHHTSSKYNLTYYYDLDEVKEKLKAEPELWRWWKEKAKNKKAKEKKQDKSKVELFYIREAIEGGDCKKLRKELKKIDVEKYINEKMYAYGSSGDTPLKKAIELGNKHIIRQLIKAGAPINKPNCPIYNLTALHTLVISENEDIVNWFVKNEFVKIGDIVNNYYSKYKIGKKGNLVLK